MAKDCTRCGETWYVGADGLCMHCRGQDARRQQDLQLVTDFAAHLVSLLGTSLEHGQMDGIVEEFMAERKA